MKKYLIIAGLLLSELGIFGQQIPTFSTYSLNHYALNPAATGTTDQVPLALTYRKLWAGIKESPSVQYLSGHMEVYPSMGVGAKIFNFQAGPLRKTGLELSYSYHLELSEETRLSFGLSGLFYQFHLNRSSLAFEEENDAVMGGEDNMFIVDASFGTYLYARNYYVGIAVPQLINRNVDLKTDGILQQKQVRHYYLHGGYKFEINRDYTLEPSLLFKFVEAGLFQADINVRAEYKEMFSLGISYRSSDAVVIQLGFRYERFMAAYAYDVVTSGLNVSTFGSHEVTLIYSFDNFLK